jgi:hypothetical protein
MERNFLLGLVVAVGMAAPSWAADPDEGPGRGVARISLLNGDVSVKRGDSGDFVAAALNGPLVVEDRVFTGSASRGELQFDWANFLRMSSNAEVRLAELEYRRYIVQIARGTVTWRVLRDQDAEIEISTPNISVRPVKRGAYRITVLEDGTSEVTVRSGEAEIYTPRGSERLRSGKTMLARGTSADPEFRIVDEIRDDEWDTWNQRRDRDLERSRSYQYLSRDIYGAEDLDDHGRWVHVSDYGYVWSPRVAAGWAPYRYGRWSWIDWYGWNWVSYDPWGWAPYHYGRWFYSAPYGWCWYPGSIRARHYWSPALVAFVGFGRGIGVGIGAGFGWGHVGWIPLAPRDPFHRWWGSRYYGGYRNRGFNDNSVNIVNNVNITNVYRNARIGSAVTAVDQDGFSRGRGGRAIRLNEGEFTRASLVQGQVPVAPRHESLRLADRTVTGVHETRTDRFFSRRTAAQVDRVPFEDQRRGMENVARRTFGEESSGSRSARVTEGAAEPSRTAEGETRGWRRADEPARGSDYRRFGLAPSGETRAAEGDRRDHSVRFGEPAATSRTVPERTAPERAAPEDGNSWRRFGDRSTFSESPRGSWRRDLDASSTRSESPRMDSPSRSESRSPRMERRSAGDSDAVRISPPIVRDRGGDRGGTRGFGESLRSAPRMESPRMEAPRNDGGSMRGGGDRGGMRGGDAAPSRGGGGGGGGNRGGGDRGAGGEGRGGRGR